MVVIIKCSKISFPYVLKYMFNNALAMHYWLYEIILSLYSDNNYNYLYFSYIVHKYPSSNICNNILNLNTYQYIFPVYYQNVHYLCNVIYSLSKMTIYWHVLSNIYWLLPHDVLLIYHIIFLRISLLVLQGSKCGLGSINLKNIKILLRNS